MICFLVHCNDNVYRHCILIDALKAIPDQIFCIIVTLVFWFDILKGSNIMKLFFSQSVLEAGF